MGVGRGDLGRARGEGLGVGKEGVREGGWVVGREEVEREEGREGGLGVVKVAALGGCFVLTGIRRKQTGLGRLRAR